MAEGYSIIPLLIFKSSRGSSKFGEYSSEPERILKTFIMSGSKVGEGIHYKKSGD